MRKWSKWREGAKDSDKRADVSVLLSEDDASGTNRFESLESEQGFMHDIVVLLFRFLFHVRYPFLLGYALLLSSSLFPSPHVGSVAVLFGPLLQHTKQRVREMHTRVQIDKTLRSFLVASETLKCNVKHLAVVDELLL